MSKNLTKEVYNFRKKRIIEIITDNVEDWQPCGKPGSCFVIEENEPFFWKISERWAGEVADKILNEL